MQGGKISATPILERASGEILINGLREKLG